MNPVIGKRKSNKIDIEAAGLLLLAGVPHLDRLYESTISLINYQLAALNNGVSYSYLDELACNDQVLLYANSCIKMINNLYDAGLIGWQDSPSAHFLLRQYRNNSHHTRIGNFRPFQTHDGYQFYIWPELQNIPEVKSEYPVWSKTGSGLTLQLLISENQRYIRKLISETEEVIKTLDSPPRFRSSYPMATGIMSGDAASKDWELK